MKNLKYIYLALLTVAFGFTSCSDRYLDPDLDGSYLNQEQLPSVEEVIGAMMRGTYTWMYEYSGHDEFGKRSIDMYTDILCGDMAMKSATYGWFETDERMMTRAYRTAYIWYQYYKTIRLCNLAINSLDEQAGDAADRVPALPLTGEETDEELSNMYWYGQCLALRGYAYAELIRLYSDDETDYNSTPVIPLYTENITSDLSVFGAPRVTPADVYLRIEEDLTQAIAYLDATRELVDRSNKMQIDADVARNILAYAYLNKIGATTADYDRAFRYATEVIKGGRYTILPQSRVLTSGFGDITEASWMWGEPVTIENSTALGSFFGQVDIHTYSYAWAGDVRGIDANLYKDIPSWDLRKQWFESKNEKYMYAPSRKFYNVSSGNTLAAGKIDRDWLNDQVFMRVESAYLTAAEAALKKTTPDLDSAFICLDAILAQRVDTTAAAVTEYDNYKSQIQGKADELTEAIRFNWRVELWGEGYGLQTFRRFGKQVSLGDNHLRPNSDRTISPADYRFSFEPPTSESRYNPYWSSTTPPRELKHKQ